MIKAMKHSKAIKRINKRFLMEDCGCPIGAPHGCTKFKRFLFKLVSGFLFKVYYPIKSLLFRTKERTLRSWDFARFGWLNYDFDAHHLFSLMAFKLRRVHKCLVEHSVSVQQKEDLDALKEAIQICDRLFNEDHDYKYFKEHDKKWGKLPRYKSIPQKDENGKVTSYLMQPRKRANVKTKKDEKRERKDFLACYENGVKDRNKDFDRLAEILKNYSGNWWD